MNPDGFIINRKVIPRWRELNRLDPGEISSASAAKPNVGFTDDVLNFYYSNWQNNQSLENALEVLFHVPMSRRKALAFGPAEQILKTKNILPQVRQLAEKIRLPTPLKIEENFPIGDLELLREINIGKIRDLKARLANEANNCFLWLEMARLQTILGNSSKAEEAIVRAFKCAPNNRIILRAGARFLMHQGKADEAYLRLKRSEAIKYDPWVMSAEIALSGILDKSPQSIRVGKMAITDGKFHAHHISELASSIATEELKDGNDRRARQFFNKSLTNPTENSVAQAVWAQKQHVNITLPAQQLLIPRAFEAKAGTAFLVSDYKEAASQCLLWCNDEPFSSSPAVQGTFIATTFLENNELALQFYEFGIQSNPNDIRLLNNGAVSLAKLGKTEQAANLLKKVEALTSRDNNPTVQATGGLIEFRRGNIELGRQMYEKAARAGKSLGHDDLEFRAKIHWIYEEARAGTVDVESFAIIKRRLDAMAEDKKSFISSSAKKVWSSFKEKIEKDELPKNVEAAKQFKLEF